MIYFPHIFWMMKGDIGLSAYIVPCEKSHYPKRLIKEMYQKFNWPPRQEKKWSHMKFKEKKEFVQKSLQLTQTYPDIQYLSITVYKPNVHEHIRKDGNKLYNYMINLMLMEEISKYEYVNFIPDMRSIKVKSGNSLSDYLQTQLWFEKNVKTTLKNLPANSVECKGVQFADMLSGVVQQYFENDHTSL